MVTKIKEPAQPFVNFCCNQYPVLMACTIGGWCLYLSVIPQLVYMIYKSRYDLITPVDWIYVVYMVGLTLGSIGMVVLDWSHNNSKSRKVVSRIRWTNTILTLTYLVGLFGLLYTIGLKITGAKHIYPPSLEYPVSQLYDKNQHVAILFDCRPMSWDALVYAIVQWWLMDRCLNVLAEALDFAETHKLFNRLNRIVKTEIIAGGVPVFPMA